MSLDTIELVIAVEQEFDIRIADAEAEKMQLVGDVFAFVLKVINERNRGGLIDEDQIWRRLQKIFVDQLGVRLEQVTPGAHIIYDLGAD